MENINKENFFNDMKVRYPKTMALFMAFIDGYKNKNNWKSMFNEGGILWDSQAYAPKFHDIPFELQIGVLMRFMELNVAAGILGPCAAAFLLQDGFNIPGVKLNFARVLARMENNLL